MLTQEQIRLEHLEREVKVLRVQVQTLINYLQAVPVEGFGPPDGRSPYDQRVKLALEQANLS